MLASWSLAMIMAVILGAFILLPRVLPGYRPLPVIPNAAGKILRFSLVNHVSNLFWTVPTYVLPLIVLGLLGAESGAYFFMVWSITNIINMVPLATSLSLF